MHIYRNPFDRQNSPDTFGAPLRSETWQSTEHDRKSLKDSDGEIYLPSGLLKSKTLPPESLLLAIPNFLHSEPLTRPASSPQCTPPAIPLPEFTRPDTPYPQSSRRLNIDRRSRSSSGASLSPGPRSLTFMASPGVWKDIPDACFEQEEGLVESATVRSQEKFHAVFCRNNCCNKLQDTPGLDLQFSDHISSDKYLGNFPGPEDGTDTTGSILEYPADSRSDYSEVVSPIPKPPVHNESATNLVAKLERNVRRDGVGELFSSDLDLSDLSDSMEDDSADEPIVSEEPLSWSSSGSGGVELPHRDYSAEEPEDCKRDQLITLKLVEKLRAGTPQGKQRDSAVKPVGDSKFRTPHYPLSLQSPTQFREALRPYKFERKAAADKSHSAILLAYSGSKHKDEAGYKVSFSGELHIKAYDIKFMSFFIVVYLLTLLSACIYTGWFFH
ncbi:hypothetical protein FPQ18DRAFT_306024 [Pyronema domesticum]|nr:hypothetical protein FPQ18DRAFT_306024 [Pyronema domesticum]